MAASSGEARSIAPSGSVVLRGADVAPVKRRHMDYLAMLEMQLFRKRHLIGSDHNAQVLIVENIEGTLQAVLKALVSRDVAFAHAEWDRWHAEWDDTPNQERPDFAEHTLIDIFYDSRKAGLLDLREKPSPKRSSTPLTEAWPDESPEGE